MNRYIYLIAILILASCGGNKTEIKNEKNYLLEPILSGAPFKIDNVSSIKSFGKLGDYMLIARDTINPQFQLVDINKQTVVKSFGFDKQQLKNPFYFNNFWSNPKSDISFEVIDFGTNQIKTFSLSNVLGNDTLKIENKDIPFDFIKKYYQLLTLDSSALLGSYGGRDLKKGKFFIFEDKKTKWVPFGPHIADPIARDDLKYIYYSFSSYNRNRSVFASAMKYFKRVEFYSKEGGLLKEISFNNEKLNYGSGFLDHPNSSVYFNSSFAGAKYFYGLCIDSEQSNYVKNKGNMKLYVFDWEGDLKKIIKLDRMYLGNFIVDESTNKLIAQSFVKDDQAPFIVYSLPNNLK
ncbi:hypothetical protein VRU48_12850 [Pedobacter sp. KR3-3]|uniref:TolB-like 6-blade propeller-like n=1 Tax=Pedobacter albus TaxID=3113905 RepID=A0ABU7I950_9SPHI|nr:hypothetical protein [Pedobacter sp. KR3-3]MEE1946002.1 hypothetical protein [Pedobacter sp. KR3-3]